MRIVIAGDHGGFALKSALIGYIKNLGHEVYDMGCYDEKSIDYPTVAFPAAEAVAKGEYDRGILVCGTGIGVSLCANKVLGIRCALCTDPVMARLTREHNDANMLALGGRIVGLELAKGIVKEFLSTDFIGSHHTARVEMIKEYEAKHHKF